MDQPVLSDKNQYPTEEIIFSHIGKTRELWKLLFDHIHQTHSDFTEQWRYYLDGKSWLLKVTRKSKTIFWLSIVDGTFRTTFYFTDRAGPAISKSALSDASKQQFKSGNKYGKIRGITVRYRYKRDVEDAKRLIELKLAAK